MRLSENVVKMEQDSSSAAQQTATNHSISVVLWLLPLLLLLLLGDLEVQLTVSIRVSTEAWSLVIMRAVDLNDEKRLLYAVNSRNKNEVWNKRF